MNAKEPNSSSSASLGVPCAVAPLLSVSPCPDPGDRAARGSRSARAQAPGTSSLGASSDSNRWAAGARTGRSAKTGAADADGDGDGDGDGGRADASDVDGPLSVRRRTWPAPAA